MIYHGETVNVRLPQSSFHAIDLLYSLLLEFSPYVKAVACSCRGSHLSYRVSHYYGWKWFLEYICDEWWVEVGGRVAQSWG